LCKCEESNEKKKSHIEPSGGLASGDFALASISRAHLPFPDEATKNAEH